jgi:hypothetical protein
MTHDMAAGGGEPEDEDRGTDDELLYYRVLRDRTPPHYQRGEERLQVLAQAFSQRPVEEGQPFAGQYRLSVDRARLRGFNPDLTRRADPRLDPAAVGVVCLPAGEVRAVPGVADILPDPIRDDPDLPDNPAHVLICVAFNPDASKTANKNVYRDVIRDLAKIVNTQEHPWAIEPADG